MSTTTPATRPQAQRHLTLRDHLETHAFKEQVARALPRHLTPDRFIRVAATAIMRTPKLADCEQVSFFNALLSLSQFGLEPDGRRAHLIPFENRKRGVVECQLIIDYKGLAELAMRSGAVSNLHADVVRDGDLFDYNAGELKSHVPWFLRRDADKPAAAGDVFAVYSRAKFKDGTDKCEVMSRDDVEAIRSRSRAGQSGPWVTDWDEMAKKTVFRRLSKWLPLSPEFRDAADAEDEEPLPVRRAEVVADADNIFAAPHTAHALPEPAAYHEDQVPGAEVPPAAPAAAPACAATGTSVNHLRGVRGLLKNDNIEESKAVIFMHKVMCVDETLGTLEEIAMMAPSYIAELFEQWKTIGPKLKAFK